MKLSVIIVNYNAGQHIINCLGSAFKYASSKNFEWIIVDNSNDKTSAESIKQLFPAIIWIDMNYNAGFARANNAGIVHSSGDIVLLLNPDTIVIDDCINKCLLKFYADDAVACSVQLINADGTPQITGNFFMKGGLNHLLPLPYLGKFLRSIAFAFKAKKTNVVAASAYQKVDWINGAFLMLKKNVIDKAGLMDEDFFLYAEETEWCSRLKKYGELVVYGDLNIIHLQGEIINAAANSHDKGYCNLYDKKGLQLIISNNLRIRKQYGVGWYLFNVMMYVVEIPIFFLGNFFDNLFHLQNPFKNSKKAKDYTKNVLTLVWLTPKIISGKEFFYKMM